MRIDTRRLTTIMAALLLTCGLADAAAPQWLRETGVFNGWYKPWTDDFIRDKLTSMPLVIGVPADKKIVEKAHGQGARVLSYITVYQMPTAHEYEGSKLSEHPEWMVINSKGEQAKSV